MRGKPVVEDALIHQKKCCITGEVKESKDGGVERGGSAQLKRERLRESDVLFTAAPRHGLPAKKRPLLIIISCAGERAPRRCVGNSVGGRARLMVSNTSCAKFTAGTFFKWGVFLLISPSTYFYMIDLFCCCFFFLSQPKTLCCFST